MVRNLLPSLIALKVFHKIKYFMKLSISSNGVKPVAKAESCFAAKIEGGAAGLFDWWPCCR